MGVIERRVERLELDTLPACRGNSRILAADARLAKGYSHMPSCIDLVITSPPYYGMRTYIADQWLRNWFLGGPPEVPYSEECFLSHQSPVAFAESLSRVWDRIGERLSGSGKMFVRFGAIPSRKRNPREIMSHPLNTRSMTGKSAACGRQNRPLPESGRPATWAIGSSPLPWRNTTTKSHCPDACQRRVSCRCTLPLAVT